MAQKVGGSGKKYRKGWVKVGGFVFRFTTLWESKNPGSLFRKSHPVPFLLFRIVLA